MSRFVETYLSQIENLLRTQSKPKSSKKYDPDHFAARKFKHQIEHDRRVKSKDVSKNKDQIKDQETVQKQAIVNKYNMFSTKFKEEDFFINEKQQTQFDPPYTQGKHRCFKDQDGQFSDNERFSSQKQSQRQKSKTKTTYRTLTQQMEHNTYPFSKKRETINDKKRGNGQSKQKLIKTTASDKQSQRLEVIFESARKSNKLQGQGLTQGSGRKSNALLNPVKVDEFSRAILRKSFCLQMIDDDQEWERVITNSKKKWNDQDPHKY